MSDEAPKSNLIPNGTYLGRIISAKFIKSVEKETEGYECLCQITEDGPFKGRKIIHNAWLTENTAVRTLESLGYGGCQFANDNIYDTSGCDANEVAFVVDKEDYTPEKTDKNPNPKMTSRNVIKFINRGLGGRAGVVVELDEAGKKAFNAKHKGALDLARSGARNNASGGAAVPVDPTTKKALF